MNRTRRVIKVIASLLVLSLCCAGCTSVAVEKAPKVDLGTYRHIFVLQPLNENHHVDEMLVDELRQTGRDASSGPLTMLPDNADAVLSYDARWTGDFSTHLTDLALSLHTAHTDKRLAEARYYQPSPRPKSAEYVVHALVQRLLKQ